MFKRGDDQLHRIYVSEVEVPSILATCSDSACGGHFSGQLTVQKIFKICYFWPTLFKDAHDYVKRCDICQRYARNDLDMEMSLDVSLPLVFLQEVKN